MSVILVLVTMGKQESVDAAKMRCFDDVTTAQAFVDETNRDQGTLKYWSHAEILKDGEYVELFNPYR